MQPGQIHPPSQLVQDIMTTPVHTVDMDDSLLKAKGLFDREHCHHVVVLERDRVVGVVSDRDILKAISPFVGNAMERPQDRNTLKKRIHQIMSRGLVAVGPDEALATAAKQMLAERVSCLPVVDENRALLGIVTVRDFVSWAASVSHVDEGYTSNIEPNRPAEPDEQILIVIDGARCYFPPPAISRLIRQAERAYDTEHDAGLARAKCLPHPRHETVKV